MNDCASCGTAFQSTHPTKIFCTTPCQRDFNNWCGRRGKTLFLAALTARATRGRKGTIGADAQLERDRFLDACVAELRDQGGATPAKIYAASRRRSIPWMDRSGMRKS